MKFNLVNRRTHLYLGLSLIPWVLMYGLSSFYFNHAPTFNKLFNYGPQSWIVKLEKEYHRPVPENADLREIAGEILDEFGIRKSFFVSLPSAERMNINTSDFLTVKRITYYIEEGRLVLEERLFQLNTLFTSLHFRGGYQQDLFLDDLWAVVLDLVCVAFLVWIVSGIYMLWQIRRLRIWGSVAMVGGVLTFCWFILTL